MMIDLAGTARARPTGASDDSLCRTTSRFHAIHDRPTDRGNQRPESNLVEFVHTLAAALLNTLGAARIYSRVVHLDQPASMVPLLNRNIRLSVQRHLRYSLMNFDSTIHSCCYLVPVTASFFSRLDTMKRCLFHRRRHSHVPLLLASNCWWLPSLVWMPT
jgi:hypothetical protein